MRSVAFRIVGIVQGVGFREFTRRRAREHGVCGWVANTADGAVIGRAEGGPDAVERLLADLRIGPPRSRVVGLAAADAPDEGFAAFDVRI